MPVNMNDIGAQDIRVGQRWMFVVTEKEQRLVWTVAAVRHDHAVLEREDDNAQVAFGVLLSHWALLART